MKRLPNQQVRALTVCVSTAAPDQHARHDPPPENGGR
jgi:hypothetical protein